MNAKIMSTIEKLLIHAESASQIGSIEEAEAFAAQARRLMVQHKIDMSQLDLDNEAQAAPVDMQEVRATAWGEGEKRKRSAWQGSLAAALAPSYFCHILVGRGTNSLYVIGAPDDRERFIAGFAGMVRAADVLADEDYSRYLRQGNRKRNTWKQSWLDGFCLGLRCKVEAEMAKEVEVNGETAMVAVKGQMQKVNDFLKNTATHSAPSIRSGRDDGAYGKGYAAGNRGHNKRIE